MPPTTRTSAPRLLDVATRAGVSLATASRALSGTAPVSEDLARRVNEAAAALHYTANPHARTLAGRLAPVVGLMVYEIDDPYFAEIAAGVMKGAHRHGWNVQVNHQRRDATGDLATVQQLIAQRVGAIVVVGSGYLDPDQDRLVTSELETYVKDGGRAVIIGRRSAATTGIHAVAPDNEGAGRMAAEHLIQLGHRRVAVAAGPGALTTVHDRLAGILETLHDAGVGEPPVAHADFTRDGGRVAAAELLATEPDLTAIVALNDTMAIGTLSVLRERGLAVPAQISVTGIGDIQVAQDLAPALTTVQLPLAAMGENAAELALSDRGSAGRRIQVDHRLVVRGSTGSPPT